MKAYNNLQAEIESGKLKPLYLLHGDEPYYLDRLAETLNENVLSESEKAFNLTTLYGKDTEVRQVIDQVRRYPVMAAKQLVFLREAQYMRKFADLVEYFEKPVETTVLVIIFKHKKPDKRTKYYKALKKNGVVFESKKLYDNQVPAWIDQYVRQRGCSITPDALRITAEYLGTDLQKISNEIEKLILRLGESSKIDLKAVEESIGISREFNVFELQRAIGKRDIPSAQLIADNMRRNMRDNPMVLVVGAMFSYFQKIYLIKGARDLRKADQVKLLGLRNDYFLQEYVSAAAKFSQIQLEDIFGLLRKYDMRSKGVGNAHVSEDELFREMVFRMLVV